MACTHDETVCDEERLSPVERCLKFGPTGGSRDCVPVSAGGQMAGGSQPQLFGLLWPKVTLLGNFLHSELDALVSLRGQYL